MFDTICTLPLSSDLFAQAIHPSEPLLAVGLSVGHVQTFRLPPVASDDSKVGLASENGFGQVETNWRTRRHKGSCRCLGFSYDGEALYSAGTDGLVKAASTTTGQVTSKITLPLDPKNSKTDTPSLLHAPTPQTLLLATDSSALHLYDLRSPTSSLTSTPQQTHHPHDDYISSLTPLPPSDTSTSGLSKQWVTTGGTTLAVTDIRRGVLVRSEDQEEELLSSVFVGGLPAKSGRSKGEKVLVGGAGGVLTLWDRGMWSDQGERIIVDHSAGGGESLDTLAVLPDGLGLQNGAGGKSGKHVAVGLGDGRVAFVRLGVNKVVSEVRHDEVESVVGLGVDVGGRLISGGGQVVKVWHEMVEEEQEDDDENLGVGKRRVDSDSGDEAEEESSEDEGKKEHKRRKRRKRIKGKQRSGGPPHVIAFKGMD